MKAPGTLIFATVRATSWPSTVSTTSAAEPGRAALSVVDRHRDVCSAIPPVVIFHSFLTAFEWIDLEVKEDRARQCGKRTIGPLLVV